MSDVLQLTFRSQKRVVELSCDERAQLNAIIDLLIPSDKDFPPPSSLHLIDELLHHLLPSVEHKTTSLLSEKRLRTVLYELNTLAGGNFCQASSDKQQTLIQNLEKHNPAFFEALWTLVNHSYYKFLAYRWSTQVS